MSRSHCIARIVKSQRSTHKHERSLCTKILNFFNVWCGSPEGRTISARSNGVKYLRCATYH